MRPVETIIHTEFLFGPTLHVLFLLMFHFHSASFKVSVRGLKNIEVLYKLKKSELIFRFILFGFDQANVEFRQSTLANNIIYIFRYIYNSYISI